MAELPSHVNHCRILMSHCIVLVVRMLYILSKGIDMFKYIYTYVAVQGLCRPD